MPTPRIGVVAILAALGLSASACRDARALESFTLNEHDKLLAEAPGCYVECKPFDKRRECTVQEPDCYPVCSLIPECRPDGTPMQVCVVMKRQR